MGSAQAYKRKRRGCTSTGTGTLVHTRAHSQGTTGQAGNEAAYTASVCGYRVTPVHDERTVREPYRRRPRRRECGCPAVPSRRRFPIRGSSQARGRTPRPPPPPRHRPVSTKAKQPATPGAESPDAAPAAPAALRAAARAFVKVTKSRFSGVDKLRGLAFRFGVCGLGFRWHMRMVSKGGFGRQRGKMWTNQRTPLSQGGSSAPFYAAAGPLRRRFRTQPPRPPHAHTPPPPWLPSSVTAPSWAPSPTSLTRYACAVIIIISRHFYRFLNILARNGNA